MTTELFSKHLALEIEKVTNAYSSFLEEVFDRNLVSASSENIEYGFLLERLNRNINAFKLEMKYCLNDYIRMKGLKRDFYFHKNINKLTPETLLEYFEMNYLIVVEEETKK